MLQGNIGGEKAGGGQVGLTWERLSNLVGIRRGIRSSDQLAQTPQQQQEATQQSPAVRISGGVPFLSAGMPGQAAVPSTRTAAAALDGGGGAALDRASTKKVDVSSSGKLSVDVKAPEGTKVKAEGAGVFKKTEVSRQVASAEE
jgi:hypothetical protein